MIKTYNKNSVFSRNIVPLKTSQSLGKKVIRESIPNSLKNYFEPSRNVTKGNLGIKTFVLKPSQVKIKIVKMP